MNERELRICQIAVSCGHDLQHPHIRRGAFPWLDNDAYVYGYVEVYDALAEMSEALVQLIEERYSSWDAFYGDPQVMEHLGVLAYDASKAILEVVADMQYEAKTDGADEDVWYCRPDSKWFYRTVAERALARILQLETPASVGPLATTVAQILYSTNPMTP